MSTISHHLTKFLFTTSLSLCMAGCLRTEVLPSAEDPNINRLAATATRVIQCAYIPSAEETAVRGHQFALGLFPFGRVTSPPLKGLLARYLSEVAAVSGTRCSTEGEVPSSLIEVSVEDYTLSGYDLIFFRKPTAAVTLQGSRFDVQGNVRTLKRSCLATGEDYEITRFAFAADLARVQSRAWNQAISTLLNCLL